MSSQSVKEEPLRSVSDEAARVGLYAGHEIKSELVLGPVLLQPPDMFYKFNGQVNIPEPVKREPVLQMKDERPWTSDVDTSDSDVRVKQELLQHPLDIDCNLNVLDHKIGAKIKQEPPDTVSSNNWKPPTQTQLNSIDEYEQQNIFKSERDEHLKTLKNEMTEKNYANINVNILKQKIKTEIDNKLPKSKVKTKKINSDIKPETKTGQTIRLRSRLLIRYENDTDSDHSEEKIIKKNKKPKKIHKCEYCGKQFSFRGVLTNHIRIHTKETPYSCEVCSKKFSDCAVLIRHRRVHTGAKPHTCDVCGKKYSEKYLLKNHKKTHSGEKTYFCSDCPKTFINSSNYRRHQKIHMHKYSCDICMKKFETKARLASHIINHMKPKKFFCQVCGKGFGQSGHLTRHMVIHSEPNEVYACGVCKREFTQHSSLKKHVSRRVCERKKKLLK